MKLQSAVVIVFALISNLNAINLPYNYDASTRPNQGSVADVVNVAVELLSVRGVHEDTSEMTVDISIQTSWVDSRLSDVVSKETLFVNYVPNIWMPNVQIANAAHGAMSPNLAKSDALPPSMGASTQVLQLSRDGLVKLNQKMTVRISCPISMAKYPFDRQVCKMQMNSYGHSSVHLVLFWHGTISQDVPTYHPSFSFSYAEQTSENIKTPNGASYSNLYLEIAVTRCPLRVIFRAMLPALCILFLSYYVTFCHCPLLFGQNQPKKSKPPPASPATTIQQNGHHHPPPATVTISDPQVASSSSSSAPSVTMAHAVPYLEKPSPSQINLLSPQLNLLIVAINGLLFLMLVVLAQMNFMESPTSSAVSGLDVWLNFMMTVVFIILWHSIQIHLGDYKRTPLLLQYHHHTNGHIKQDGGAGSESSCCVNRITTILKLAIPTVLAIFLVAFFGIYLS